MMRYAVGQGRSLEDGIVAVAMTWTEPDRDVVLARGRALRLLADAPVGEPMRCVWSDRKLDATTLDMDHAFPWSAWPCGDLWNLVPCHREINQSKKRDKLPSDQLLLRSRDKIVSWWESAYASDILGPQFVSEANRPKELRQCPMRSGKPPKSEAN